MVAALALAGSLAWFPAVATAQCESRADVTPVDYIEYREGRFTICYSPDYPDDLDFVAPWVSRAFDLGAEKYRVLRPTYGGNPFYLTVYLPGAETALTSQGLVRMACCYPDGEGTTHAEIHYLTPAVWEGDVLGGLGQPPEYYHPHYLTHETVHFFQWACCRDDANADGYRWPTWLTEGMAESDGYRHTTEYSRTTAVALLRQRVRDHELDGAIYGENLSGDRVLAVPSVYWAGGWVMNHLADTYGDEIHLDLLRRPLADVLQAHGTTIGQLFHDLVAGLAIEPQEIPTDEYAPHVACTGRYWRSSSGLSFEVRIVNNAQRPHDFTRFSSQYRRDASASWTMDPTGAHVEPGWAEFGVSPPLFTGPSSRPFQWRVRACPSGGQSSECSGWSNVINWTAESCARVSVMW